MNKMETKKKKKRKIFVLLVELFSLLASLIRLLWFDTRSIRQNVMSMEIHFTLFSHLYFGNLIILFHN